MEIFGTFLFSLRSYDVDLVYKLLISESAQRSMLRKSLTALD